MSKLKIMLCIILLSTTAIFYFLDGWQFFSLSNLKNQQQMINELTLKSPLLVAALFFVIYLLLSLLFLPGAVLLTLLAGALYGNIYGTLLSSMTSSLAASAAFVFARYLFRPYLQCRYYEQFQRLNKDLAKHGVYYLIALRLTPILPFFLVNMLMGLSNISLAKYHIVSQLAMLPITFILVNAGSELANINEISDVLSTELIVAFCALAFFVIATNLFFRQQQKKVKN
ncbi:MAG: TVP38/TMEM64 family protein [Psychrobium sp.]|nr:TVP38/TMEM64 family protein [Psychrobium sp.]